MSWKFELLMKPEGELITEGPVWTGEEVLFTHIRRSRILRYDHRSGGISEWRSGTNRTNGLCFDAHGRLFGCCSGGRSIVRFDADGKNTVIADKLDGKRLNTPNDLAIDRQGRIWFTNPINDGNWDKSEVKELDHQSVLCAIPQGDGSYSVKRVTLDTTQPNGILVSPDQRTLYVAESGYARGRNRELRAYPIQDDGTLGAYDTLFTWGEDARGLHRGIDGMCLDAEGNIIATNGWEVSGPGPMLTVFSPTGRVLETHPIACNRPTNVCFGGSDMTTVFVTSTNGHFFRAKTDRVGWAMYP
jgi:gluconolactonase